MNVKVRDCSRSISTTTTAEDVFIEKNWCMLMRLGENNRIRVDVFQLVLTAPNKSIYCTLIMIEADARVLRGDRPSVVQFQSQPNCDSTWATCRSFKQLRHLSTHRKKDKRSTQQFQARIDSTAAA